MEGGRDVSRKVRKVRQDRTGGKGKESVWDWGAFPAQAK